LKNLSEEEQAEKNEEYKRISLAFRTLIDPEKRKRYDETGTVTVLHQQCQSAVLPINNT
jgi:DnaJ-class molecular chaperone